jgi:hypothetical protein
MAEMKDEYKFPDEQEKEAEPQVEIEGEGELEIEVVDDTPEKDRGRKPLEKPVEDPTDSELDDYSEGVKRRIKELTHARHDERRQKEAVAREKEELQRLTQQLLEENNSLKQRVNTGQEIFAETAKQKVEAELEMARRQLKEAHEAFDTDAIIAAQEKLAEMKMRSENLKNFKLPALQPTEIPVQNTQPQTQRSQPDEKSLRWQAKNQWFGQPGFEEYTSYALGLHQKLVNGGVDPRTEEYFDQIDGRMKTKFPELFGGAEEKPKTSEVQKKPSTVVAPATRSTGAGKIRLTATQVALAKKLGLTPQQYAAQVAKLENQNG